ncbi:MAG: LysR family transcriptional regulator [Oscillospiraceae bacterium]|nr:LysR family transcriptional regulator [Oscillospiraceae bacterium]
MTIQQCKYVLEIARTGSFSQAAKQLFVAQSSLSISVKSLEQELNIRIFERSGNGVYLTDDGAEFVRYAKQIVENEDFITCRYHNPQVQKKLYIATQHYDFIADIFANFVSTRTEESYQFSIKEIETYNVIREVELAYSDIGIIAIKDSDSEILKRYLSSKNIAFTPVLQAAPHVFLRTQHPMAGCELLHQADLKDYPYVSYEQGEHHSSFFTEEMMDPSNVRRRIEISDRATLMNLLMVTDAYTVGTGIMPSALNGGNIVSIPLDSEEYYVIGYLLNENRKVSPVAEKFITLLQETVKTYGGAE